MKPPVITPVAAAQGHGQFEQKGSVRLRLFVARSTPNSVRAERNLKLALAELQMALTSPDLEIIDVFLHPKRAITDGVVVTPTLIGIAPGKRILLMGDLADRGRLELALQDLFHDQI